MDGPSDDLPPDYLALGHVTLDRQPDGSVLPGGTVLYAALQAARLGLRATIVTRAREAEVHDALAPYRSELTIWLQPAPETTTFTNAGIGAARRQLLHAWAGLVDLAAMPPALLAAPLVHLAPVAWEIDSQHLPPFSPSALLTATPQGWLRRRAADDMVTAAPLVLPEALLARLDALVVSETEERLTGGALAAVRARGGLAAITRGKRGCLLLTPTGEHAAPALRCPLVDDTGAGDIFAAALFVALAEGRAPVAAARFANAAAGLSIGGRGVSAIASRAAIEQAMHAAWPAADSPD